MLFDVQTTATCQTMQSEIKQAFLKNARTEKWLRANEGGVHTGEPQNTQTKKQTAATKATPVTEPQNRAAPKDRWQTA